MLKIITNFFFWLSNLYIVVTHAKCLDGHSCVAIVKGINDQLNMNTYAIYLNPGDKIFNYWLFKYFSFILEFASRYINITIMFTDIIPPDTIECIKYFNKSIDSSRYISIEIHDHHYTQNAYVEKLKELELPKSKLFINFDSDLKFGATLLLVEKYNLMLLDQQKEYFIKLAACDMWNKDYFPNFIFYIFGLNEFNETQQINMIDPNIIWDLSFDGDVGINTFIGPGKRYYDQTEKMLDYWIKTNINQAIIKYNDENILVINTSELSSPYNKSSKMVSVISYYLSNKNDYNIDILAIYSNISDYVSLRGTKSNSDVTKIAILCEGGGHKKAAGCKLAKFKELIGINN